MRLRTRQGAPRTALMICLILGRACRPDLKSLSRDRTGLVSEPIHPIEAGRLSWSTWIKKAFYMGLGLAVLTKEKAKELVKDLAEQAKLSEHEGKDLVEKNMMRQSDQGAE